MYDITKLRYWCHKVIPLVYDDSLSYYEVLCKVTNVVNQLIDNDKEIVVTLDEVQNAIETLNVEEIAQMISEIEPDVASLKNKVNHHFDFQNFAGSNIVFFGDSWTVGSGTTDHQYRYTTAIANALNLTEFNFGVGASGFTRPLRFIDQVNTAASEMTASQKNNTAIVMLVGGVNDISHDEGIELSDVLDAEDVVIAAMHSTFPNALIVLGLCNTRLEDTSINHLNWIRSMQERAEYRKSYPIVVLKNITNYIRNITKYYNNDGLHPTNLGHGIFAAFIVNEMLGGGGKVFRLGGSFSFVEGVASAGSVAPTVFKDDNMMCLDTCSITFDEPITENTLIASIPSNYAPHSQHIIPCAYGNELAGTLLITSSGNIYANVCNGKSSISALNVPSSTWFCK